ncbi:hypothetical protein HTY52_26685 [Cupriavidus taiwanensis]|uniref:hypothetical protein n=1 Tax=Cupriavidus taiwanensis TaxID=164546 RepID=UPI001573A889|nr:hypothetical protein [Cupriavidus taiwanensis]NSX17687.1 hypothetical protein [Cupriavidus taiwanensis]
MQNLLIAVDGYGCAAIQDEDGRGGTARLEGFVEDSLDGRQAGGMAEAVKKRPPQGGGHW